MEGGKQLLLKMAMVMIVMFVYGGKRVEGQVHHVVGDDHGWDIASDIVLWASSRTFTVGDFIWFVYSGGLGKDNIVELRSKDEFESCDLSNPIKNYTDGLDQILLQEEGIRYFASSDPDRCKKGLKLPVDIKPKSTSQISQSLLSSSTSTIKAAFFAQEPTAPSSSIKVCGPAPFMVIVAAWVIFSYVTL